MVWHMLASQKMKLSSELANARKLKITRDTDLTNARHPKRRIGHSAEPSHPKGRSRQTPATPKEKKVSERKKTTPKETKQGTERTNTSHPRPPKKSMSGNSHPKRTRTGNGADKQQPPQKKMVRRNKIRSMR